MRSGCSRLDQCGSIGWVLSSPHKASSTIKVDAHGIADPANASKSDPRLRVQKRKNGRSWDKSRDKKPKNIDNATAAAYSALAKEYHRCTACGWLIQGRDKAAHAASSECKPALFDKRMALVAKFKAEGKDPNAKLLAK
jgi:hypothetical protein